MEFTVSGNWSAETLGELQQLFTQSYEHFSRLLGEPSSPGPWRLERKCDRRPVGASVYGRERRAVLQPGLSPAVVLHELTHVMHGERTTNFDFFSEGIANAAADLIARACGYRQLPQLKEYTFGNITYSMLPVPPYRPSWGRFSPLTTFRGMYAARVWKEAEIRSPGFLRRFHRAWKNLPMIPTGPEEVPEFCPSDLISTLEALEEASELKGFQKYEARSRRQQEERAQLLSTRPYRIVTIADPGANSLYLYLAKLTQEGWFVPGGSIRFVGEHVVSRGCIQARVVGLRRRGKQRTIEEGRSHEVDLSTQDTGKVSLPLNQLEEIVGRYPTYKIVFRGHREHSAAWPEMIELERCW